jgi:hypothetical protein
MTWRSHIKALLCALFLLAILAVVATKALPPVTAYEASVVVQITKTYPSLEASFELESSWDKGALWDDEAPAFDLSRF